MDFFGNDEWFTTRQLHSRINEVRRSIVRGSIEKAGELRALHRAIDQLEIDLGRSLLKFHALIDVLTEKGLIDTEELTAMAREIDGLDGENDGILHPMLFRTEEERERCPPPAGSFLFELEKQPVASPHEFLAQLAENDGVADPPVSMGDQIEAALSRSTDRDIAAASRRKFTPQQGQYLAFIFFYTKLHKHGPNEVDCQAHFGGSLPAVRQVLDEMQAQDLIARRSGSGEAIALLVPRDELPELE